MRPDTQARTHNSPARTLTPHAVLSGPEKFQAVLAVRPCARSRHFHVHHLPLPGPLERGPRSPAEATDGTAADELSTGVDTMFDLTVDGRQWRLGLIVPKRHAKRAVTRNLVKRRMRVLWLARLADMPAGDWLLRLTSQLDRKLWLSAASAPLADMVTAELKAVLDDAVRRVSRSPQPTRPQPTQPRVTTPAGGADAAEPTA